MPWSNGDPRGSWGNLGPRPVPVPCRRSGAVRRHGEKKMNVLRTAILAAACSAGLAVAAAPAPAVAQTTLRAVMHSDLKILDPIWTTAYIVRNHGYMIYDTLLAQDEKGAVQPQMVEKYDTAADGKS